MIECTDVTRHEIAAQATGRQLTVIIKNNSVDIRQRVAVINAHIHRPALRNLPALNKTKIGKQPRTKLGDLIVERGRELRPLPWRRTQPKTAGLSIDILALGKLMLSKQDGLTQIQISTHQCARRKIEAGVTVAECLLCRQTQRQLVAKQLPADTRAQQLRLALFPVGCLITYRRNTQKCRVAIRFIAHFGL